MRFRKRYPGGNLETGEFFFNKKHEVLVPIDAPELEHSPGDFIQSLGKMVTNGWSFTNEKGKWVATRSFTEQELIDYWKSTQEGAL